MLLAELRLLPNQIMSRSSSTVALQRDVVDAIKLSSLELLYSEASLHPVSECENGSLDVACEYELVL